MGGDKYVCTLSPELLQRAKDEINEDPDRREADIEHIRDWLRHQPHINARMDDWTILRFLRGCKFSLERTKEKLDMFYTCKSLCPEWYKNRDPQDKKLRSILELGLVLPLTGRSSREPLVVIVRPALRNPATTDINDVTKAMLLVMDLLLEEDETVVIRGLEVVLDSSAMTWQHAAQMNPSVIKKAAVIMQDGYPMRPKGLNYINTPEAFNTVFNIFKSFMKEKMKRRVHIHGSDMESLYKEVPRDILPVEYGGTNGTVEEIKNYWLQRLDARRDWLLEDEKFCVDESKRPGKAKTSADLFGIEGSFRKLNVD
ncbi:alpha-tocopherol transfer protein-like isoform X6 [Eriocheir sinensis]|uniref:alpha-tocopherol transfer protein-like isoform X6 n=1 Tax=Eriocheir sinensis TaxID=95602 RepID=UPI0021CAA757|nr:alpha-tocopherol transfer protein-like isoform X6 [Eriocheir sinensis]